MRQLIYLIGAPGAGKSTLMGMLTCGWERRTAPAPGPQRDWLINRDTCDVDAVEIGRRRAEFSGTDALGSAIINVAQPWLETQTETDLVLAEGARLGNRRFLSAAVAAGYETILVHLDHPDVDEWRASRARALGREQNPSWVAGRATACRNLSADPPDGVIVLRGHPDALFIALDGRYF